MKNRHLAAYDNLIDSKMVQLFIANVNVAACMARVSDDNFEIRVIQKVSPSFYRFRCIMYCIDLPCTFTCTI